MNVATLAVCKELYELSRWEGLDNGWSKYPAPSPLDHQYKMEHRSNPESPKRGSIPAYDLGYLLRQLAAHHSYGHDIYLGYIHDSENGPWEAIAHYIPHTKYIELGHTPEDACAKLCIELIKSGVIDPTKEAV